MSSSIKRHWVPWIAGLAKVAAALGSPPRSLPCLRRKGWLELGRILTQTNGVWVPKDLDAGVAARS